MKNMRKILCAVLAVVMCTACAAMFTGCGAKASPDKLSIGGIGPITGDAAIYGAAVKNGAQIAVDEINALGGLQIELNFQDDVNDAEKGVNAYNNLMDWGMQILMGTVTTTPSVSVSSEANEDRVFMLTPSASSTDVIGGFPDASGNVSIARKDNVFQLCFTDPNQGIGAAEYIADRKLGEKIAIIYNSSDVYSTGIYDMFMVTAEELNLDVVSVTSFTNETATDFNVQLNEAKNAGADLVFLPIYYTPATLMLKQADAMGYEPSFLGVDGMDGILTVEGFDTSLAEGLMFMTPFASAEHPEFTNKYVESYGVEPNQFAADAYDCIYAIYEACKIAGIDGSTPAAEACEKLIAVFTDPEFSVDGLTGAGMQWTADGLVSKIPQAVVIKDGKYIGM
ncbi:MAG: ABC transporter substrate-binding protein [Clostridia bacterium]|nr:ABC transporter substrate-binding protein [Clostridia bacterium]